VVAYSGGSDGLPAQAEPDPTASPVRPGTIVIVTPPADHGDPDGWFMDL